MFFTSQRERTVCPDLINVRLGMDSLSYFTNTEDLLCILNSMDTAVRQTNSLASGAYIPVKAISSYNQAVVLTTTM